MSKRKATPAGYVSPAGYHMHRCPTCGTIWEHSDTCADAAPAVREFAHTCPEPGAAGSRSGNTRCSTRTRRKRPCGRRGCAAGRFT